MHEKPFEKVQKKYFYSFCLKIFHLHVRNFVLFKVMFIYSCIFKFCLISNYSNSVLLLTIFVLLHKQGKLTITRKKKQKKELAIDYRSK